MPAYGHPGVYISEFETPLIPIGSIPGGPLPAFASLHNRGPTFPVLVHSWAQYIATYGTFADNPGGILPYAISQFFSNGGSATFVLRVANDDATSSGTTLPDIAGDAGGAVSVTASSVGAWGQRVAVQVTVTNPGFFNLLVYLVDASGDQNLVESFPALSMNPADQRYFPAILESPAVISQISPPQNQGAGSQYVTLTNLLSSYSVGASDLTPTSGAVLLTGGNDGSDAPDMGASVTAGFDMLPNQILAVNIPGEADVNVLTSLINWATAAGDKIVVCDGPAPVPAAVGSTGYAGTVVSEYLNLVETGSPTLPRNSYGVVYAPWLLSQDPSSSFSGATRWLPPGPAVLAQWQVNDIRVGPWQTPAGLEYSLNGVLALEAQFTNAQLDVLNLAEVNVIKPIPGAGYCIYGGRTLDRGYPDQYLAVRRELMSLEHDMTNLLQFAVFEPNGPDLWAQVTSVLENYLGQLFQQGVFAGTTAQTSYVVICDSTVNTPATAQSGLLIVNVSVALLSPAEFIQINLTQSTAIATASS